MSWSENRVENEGRERAGVVGEGNDGGGRRRREEKVRQGLGERQETGGGEGEEERTKGGGSKGIGLEEKSEIER